MKRLYFLLTLILTMTTAFAQQVVTRSNVNLRSLPTTDSRVLLQIPRGTSIELSGCETDWCEIYFNGQTGYIAKQYTVSESQYRSIERKESAHPLEPVNYYTNSRGNTVQSPTHYDRPPAGATAKCRDGSYSFSQSRRGTCSHHGGVAMWLQ